jgi:uncharacterized C2H2 Zn-finger protein
MNEQTFKIWFAGFYEGEGTIGNDKHNNNRLCLSVSQNDPVPLCKAQDIWGGTISKRTRKSCASEKICVGYEWRLSHCYALKFIKDIKPFMIIPYKISQMNIAIQVAEKGNPETYKCNFCDKVYSLPSGRRRHELKEHINKETVFKCELCDRTYNNRDSLRRHKRINHQNTDASPEIFESLGEAAQLRETP